MGVGRHHDISGTFSRYLVRYWGVGFRGCLSRGMQLWQILSSARVVWHVPGGRWRERRQRHGLELVGVRCFVLAAFHPRLGWNRFKHIDIVWSSSLPFIFVVSPSPVSGFGGCDGLLGGRGAKIGHRLRHRARFISQFAQKEQSLSSIRYCACLRSLEFAFSASNTISPSQRAHLRRRSGHARPAGRSTLCIHAPSRVKPIQNQRNSTRGNSFRYFELSRIQQRLRGTGKKTKLKRDLISPPPPAF